MQAPGAYAAGMVRALWGKRNREESSEVAPRRGAKMGWVQRETLRPSAAAAR